MVALKNGWVVQKLADGSILFEQRKGAVVDKAATQANLALVQKTPSLAKTLDIEVKTLPPVTSSLTLTAREWASLQASLKS